MYIFNLLSSVKITNTPCFHLVRLNDSIKSAKYKQFTTNASEH